MWTREKLKNLVNKIGYLGSCLVVLIGVYLVERHSYLLFHTLVELFSVCVAFAIFMIVWNSRAFIQNNYMMFLGIAYAFVGVLDLIHALAFEGMGVFPTHGANLATQLWIGARYIESLSLVIAPVFLQRRILPMLVLLVGGLLTGFILLSTLVQDNSLKRS